MLTIYAAHAPEHLPTVRTLLEEYAEAFGYNLCFQSFDEELATLPGAYAPPEGALLLADWDGAIAGSVALRRLDEEACEVKRLYVRPAFRGHKIGRALAEAILDEGRRRGYRTACLDTLDEMERARMLYRRLGFRETAPYYAHPLPGVQCMTLELGTQGETAG